MFIQTVCHWAPANSGGILESVHNTNIRPFRSDLWVLTDANAMITVERMLCLCVIVYMQKAPIQYGLHNFGDKQVNQLNAVQRINHSEVSTHTITRPGQAILKGQGWHHSNSWSPYFLYNATTTSLSYVHTLTQSNTRFIIKCAIITLT